MYSKEQIVEEIKRIAASLGANTLRALKEAGLAAAAAPARVGKKEEPKNGDELLSDLVRLYKISGEFPTPALIQTKGKYSERHYKERWRSIAEAFKMARLKFPEKFKPSTPETETFSPIPSHKKTAPGEPEEPVIPGNPLERTNEEEPRDKLAFTELGASQGEDPMIYNNNEEIKAHSIKLIPPTIKPQKTQLKSRVPIEPIDFRGLRFAPTNKAGVVYLFGMISQELGFSIEGFIKNYPDCEGKRCVDQENNLWEQVRIQLEYKSSDFKESAQVNGYDERQCDLMVCWAHDWGECPFEILELRSILPLLA
jgi:hypothetical protein